MNAPWVLSMRWENLAFLHWPVPPAALAPHLPRGLTLDIRQGEAWLGVVPFVMTDVRPRGVPFGHTFAELNLRTYVTAGACRACGSSAWTRPVRWR